MNQQSRFIPVFLGLALILAILATAAIWLLAPLGLTSPAIQWHPALIISPLLLAAARLGIALSPRSGRNRPRSAALLSKIALSLGVTFMFFLGIEQLLEWAGYQRLFPPILIQDKTSRVEDPGNGIVHDDMLLHRFEPGTMFRGRRVNSIGFLGREVNPRKKPGTRRVICMGDSVSAQGLPPYSDHLHAMLTNAPPLAGGWEAFNMAVHGYSSSQGLRLFINRGMALAPDYVVVMYGWNDHYQSFAPDNRRMGVEMKRVRAIATRILTAKRFGQLLLSSSIPYRKQHRQKGVYVMRVPAQEYRKNIHSFVTETRNSGAVPILMTTPRAKKLHSLLVTGRQMESLEAGIRLHDEYNQIVREIAAATKTELIELAQIFTDADHQKLFSHDGIHFSPDEARIRIARHIYNRITALTAPLRSETDNLSEEN